MRYNIVATGSTGNCVIVEDCLMFDCGVSFEKIKAYAPQIKYLFLTHIHSDHFNLKTINKLINDYNVVVIAPDYLNIGFSAKTFQFDNLSYQMVELYHNVENTGYLVVYNGKKLIYATDTNRIDHIEAKGYDLYLVECNHDAKKTKIEVELNQSKGIYDHRVHSLKNHLSFEKWKAWIDKNAKKPCVIVPLHMSNGGE